MSWAQEAPDFWQPRSYESLVIAGIDRPFSSYRDFVKKQSDCRTKPLGSFCKILLKTQLPLEVATLHPGNVVRQSTRLFVFGESHLEELPKKIMKEWLRELRDQYGFTHVALEAFNADYQKSLDAYLSGQITEFALREILESQWFYNSLGYIDIAREAKALGLGLVAVDDRDQPSSYTFSQSLEARDSLWTEILEQILSWEPHSKIVLLAGKTHSFERFSKPSSGVKTVIQQLELKGFPGQSILVSEAKRGLYPLLYRHAGHSGSMLYTGDEILPYTSGLVLSH